MSDVKQVLDYKLKLNHGVTRHDGGTFVAASATWLQLPHDDLRWLVEIMYESVDRVPHDVEAQRLATMANPQAWVSLQYRLVARLVGINGMAKMLWCCAPLMVEMLRLLWTEAAPPGVFTI